MATTVATFGEKTFSNYAIYKCKGCGKGVSPNSGFEFHPIQTGIKWRDLDGIYCGSCFSATAMNFSSGRGQAGGCQSLMGICGFLNELLQCCVKLIPK